MAKHRLDGEHRVELTGRRQQDGEGEQRPEHRSGRVHRTMHAERGSEPFRRGAQRDQRVARSGADALPHAVHQHDRRHAADTAPHGQQGGLADGGEAVAHAGDLLVALPAVRQHTAPQPHERRAALVQALDDAVLERRGAQREDEVDRQDGRDHLRGHVREHAREAEQHDVAGHARVPATARLTGGRSSTPALSAWYMVTRTTPGAAGFFRAARPRRRRARRPRASRACGPRRRRRRRASGRRACEGCSSRASGRSPSRARARRRSGRSSWPPSAGR